MQGFRIVSFYRPDTGQVVQIENVVAGETKYDFAPHEDGAKDPHGGTYFGGGVHTFVCRFTGTAAGQALMNWYQQGVPVRCVAIAAHPNGRNLQWYQTTLMTHARPVEVVGEAKGRADVYEVKMVTDSPRAKVYSNVNLLAYLGWQDTDPANGVMDGYTLTGTAVSTTPGGTQRVAVSSSTVTVSATLELPVAGLAVMASGVATDIHGTALSEVGVAVQTFAGVAMASSFSEYEFTGEAFSANATVPVGGYKVVVTALKISGGTTYLVSAVKDITLRTDGKDIYTPY